MRRSCGEFSCGWRPMAAIEVLKMSNWKSIDSAAKDGKPVLLFARFKTIPDDVPGPIIGYWHKAIERWKVWPDHLERADELIPTHWTELPAPPT
jgi:hypothetical protein